MKVLLYSFAFVSGVISLVSCKKTPDYIATPYECACGSLTWQGAEYPLLGTTYILTDSTNARSRRYHITSDVLPEGEYGPHGLSVWIEIDDIGNGGGFVMTSPNVGDFAALVDEYNPNDPSDTLRRYEPVIGSVQVGAAPVTGGTESVSFQLTLNQLESPGVLLPGDLSLSGSFTVGIAPW